MTQNRTKQYTQPPIYRHPPLSAYEILSREISNYTTFRFTATLDIKPKIPVSIQWRTIGILIYAWLNLCKKIKALYPLRPRDNHIGKSI